MIYVIGGIKGGSGKSTIATNLTIMLSQQDKDVLLIDADDQKTASDFTTFRNEATQGRIGYTAIQLANKAVRDQTIKLKPKYDHIIIDTGGRDTTSQRAAISIADLYLVPFIPRSFDIWTLERVAQLIEEMKTINPSLQALSFLNKADFRGTDNSAVEDFLKDNQSLTFIQAPIGNRKAFSNAAAQGLSITEVKPLDKKAIQEFKQLFQHCINTKIV